MSRPFPCRAITVYCSSSNHVDGVYVETARELGRCLAEAGYTLVFGGGHVGLMGVLSEAVRRHGGNVKGVILQKFIDMGVADPHVTDMEVAPDMRARKAGLERLGDAYIALPGGFGTLEEVTEILSFKQLGFHNKPVVLLNVNGYFDGLVRQFEASFAERFVHPRYRALYEVVPRPQDALEVIRNYSPPEASEKLG